MSVQILCCGDIHLGLSPSKVPDHLRSKLDLTLPAALKELCNLAIHRKFSAVVFSGDVADSSNSFFEAYAALKNEMIRLEKAEIPVLAVAGNHDFDVLAKLADELPGFILLGRDGNWESRELKLTDTETSPQSIRFMGRSFVSRHESESPLTTYVPPVLDIPTIGLLHCDVNQPSSNYAPVSFSELEQTCPTAWVLGHIHNPQKFKSPRPIFYPGTLQGLDPGETGPHGAWMLTIESPTEASVLAHPLAPLRYEVITVDISELNDIADVQREIAISLEKWHKQNETELDYTRAVSARLVLEGSTSLVSQSEKIESSFSESTELVIGNVTFFIERITCNLSTPFSLESLSESSDLPGVLAKKLIIVRDRSPQSLYREFISELSAALSSDKVYSQLGEKFRTKADEESLRAELLRSGTKLLSQLLLQRENQ